MWAIAKKDFKTIFFSPIGYMVVAIFLIVFGAIIYVSSVGTRSVDFNTIYYAMALYGLPIITAVLTMRSFSEERSKDTEKLLYSSPRSIFSIICGKFIALFAVICICVVLTLLYYILLLQFGVPNIKLIGVTILGFLLLSMAYITFGILISSLTENQVISALITLVFLMLPLFVSYGDGILSYLSIIDFYAKFPIGLISIKEIVGLISFSIACVSLTLIEIKRRKKFD